MKSPDIKPGYKIASVVAAGAAVVGLASLVESSSGSSAKSAPAVESTSTTLPTATTAPALSTTSTTAEVTTTTQPQPNPETAVKQAMDFEPGEHLPTMRYSILGKDNLIVTTAPGGANYPVPSSGIEFNQPQLINYDGQQFLSSVNGAGSSRQTLFIELTAANKAALQMSDLDKQDNRPFVLTYENVTVARVDNQTGWAYDAQGRQLSQVLLQQADALPPVSSATTVQPATAPDPSKLSFSG